MAGLGLIKNTKIKIEVQNGYAPKPRRNTARKLNAMLDKEGKQAGSIRNSGLVQMTVQSSAVCFWKMKKSWELYIAFGNNVSMGGTINVPIHLDGVIKKPTVYLDDKIIMQSGKLLV